MPIGSLFVSEHQLWEPWRWQSQEGNLTKCLLCFQTRARRTKQADLEVTEACVAVPMLTLKQVLCMCVCDVWLHIHGGQKTTLWNFFSLHLYVGSEDESQVTGLMHKYLYPLSLLVCHTFPFSSLPSFLFLNLKNYVYGYFACMSVCVPRICLVPREARRRQ